MQQLQFVFSNIFLQTMLETKLMATSSTKSKSLFKISGSKIIMSLLHSIYCLCFSEMAFSEVIFSWRCKIISWISFNRGFDQSSSQFDDIDLPEFKLLTSIVVYPVQNDWELVFWHDYRILCHQTYFQDHLDCRFWIWRLRKYFWSKCVL